MDTLDNKYQIEQLLGKGGMGAVYRATHLGTKRTVAVKVIHPQLSRTISWSRGFDVKLKPQADCDIQTLLTSLTSASRTRGMVQSRIS